MSKQIFGPSDIPEAPYYVLANDRFLSGWGAAEGKTSVVILPCADYSEAQRVEEHALFQRSDMNRVRVLDHKPRLNHRTHIYHLLDRDTAKSWYPRTDAEKYGE